VCGFAHELRAPTLVVLRDHTGQVELVTAEAVEDLALESAIEAVGTVEAPGGRPRVVVERLEVPGPAVGPPPISETSSLEERLDWRHLDLRRPRNRLVFAVQTTALRAMRGFWLERGLIELQSPKLRPTPNKSGASLFAIDYFGRPAYLAQSPQFYKQMAMAAGLDGIFEVGPVFRPQPERSSRHDTEFTSVDVELAWIGSLEDVLAFEEEMLRGMVEAVQAEHGDAVAHWFGTELRVPSTPFPRVSFAEARRIVEATGWRSGAEDDLDPEGERRLGQAILRAEGHEFVFVTDYPDLARPFYHMRCSDGSRETRSFDLLWKGLEITSGAQREHRYERLVEQATARGIAVELIRRYLDYFRFGCPPHGGFGLGLSRTLMSMLEVEDVREVTYLFRGPERLSP
jgi:aspartyl/asparaginyl-tRNA synthetase